MRTIGLCVPGRLDAEIDGRLGGPGEVVVQRAGSDEGACLEELLRGREGHRGGDCGGAVQPFGDVGGDGPCGVVAADWEYCEVNLSGDAIGMKGGRRYIPSNSFPTSIANKSLPIPL